MVILNFKGITYPLFKHDLSEAERLFGWKPLVGIFK
jgi:hypothetical protein